MRLIQLCALCKRRLIDTNWTEDSIYFCPICCDQLMRIAPAWAVLSNVTEPKLLKFTVQYDGPRYC